MCSRSNPFAFGVQFTGAFVNGFWKPAIPLLLAVALAACNASGSPAMPATAAQSLRRPVPQWEASGAARRACTDARPGFAECDTLIVNRKSDSGPAGWTPDDLRAVYHLPTDRRGTIVAIVVAFDNPQVESDLAYYRSYFGLPPATIFKFNQWGVQGHYPKGNYGWGHEIDLDTQMVSAGCPKCTIYLIESERTVRIISTRAS